MKNKLNLFNIPLEGKMAEKPIEFVWSPKEAPTHMECYTDGGCHNNGRYQGIGAWAWYIKTDLVGATYSACKGVTNTTNNEMELRALYELLGYLSTHYDTTLPIKIYSDSRYVVSSINEAWYVNWLYNGWKNSDGMAVKNVELWQAVIELYNKFENLKLIHIRGHRGIYGNERCDKLCSEEINRLKRQR